MSTPTIAALQSRIDAAKKICDDATAVSSSGPVIYFAREVLRELRGPVVVDDEVEL